MITKGLYKLDKEFYVVIGETKTHNSTSREWERHVLYVSTISGEMLTIEKKEFEKKFHQLPRGFKLC